MAAALSGNEAQQQQVQQQAEKQAKAFFAPLQKALKLWQLLKKDPPTRHLLVQFAEDYWHSATPMMLAKDIGKMVGGFIPAIILALITKDPGFLAAGAASASVEVSEAATIAEAMGKTLEEIEECQVLEGVEVDNRYDLLMPPKGIEEGAEHESQVKRFEPNDEIELVHPTGKKYNLPKKETPNFSGRVIPKILPPGTKLIRFFDKNNPNSKLNGGYWILLEDLPASKAEWRALYAVLEDWNKDGYYVIYEVGPEGMYGWEGVSATQAIEQFPGWVQAGGGKQIYLPNAKNEIPENLEIRSTSELWGVIPFSSSK